MRPVPLGHSGHDLRCHRINLLIDERLLARLDRDGNRDRLEQRAEMLSGGEQQMLAIGRALLTRRRLLMLDEPSQDIMPQLVDKIFQAVERIRDVGMTVPIVEQRMSECLEIADRADIPQKGRVLMQSSAADISANPDVRKAHLGM